MWSVQIDMWGVCRSRGSLVVERGREREREGGIERGREGGRKGEREGGREREREGGRERGGGRE